MRSGPSVQRVIVYPLSGFLVPALVLGLAAIASAADPKPVKPPPAKPAAAKTPQIADEAAIRATAADFVKAFNRADAKSIAAIWTAYGTMADDEGEILKGQTAIEDKYAAFFKAYPGAKIEVAVKSVEFPTPEVAVEDGVAQVSAENAGPPVASRYTAFHVRIDGIWRMASVREAKIELASNYPRVAGLGWLVGHWKTERDGTTIDTTIRWIANKSFLEREYTVRKDGIPATSGTQIIGWDPKAGQIRSWSFDSSGGHGTGLWTATPGGWQIASTGIMADGTPTASREVLIRVPHEDNVLGWRSTQRRAGNVALPDTPEVVLDRIVGK